jgi:hypothetical protein
VVVRYTVVLFALLAMAGCSTGGHPKHQQPSGPPLVIPKPPHAPTGRPRPAGPGTACGQVTTVIGTQARVVVVTGRTTCATALHVFRKYYDPATPAEGSAGLAVIDHWTCASRLKVSTCTLKATEIQARS